MPRGHWGHGNIRAQQLREHDWLFPQLEQTPDLTRGQMRLAAEVAIDEIDGRTVDREAHERAHETLRVLARG